MVDVRKSNAKLKMGGKTDLERVVSYIPSEYKKELEAWAQTDERSVSWVVAKLIDKALQERRKQQRYSALPNKLSDSSTPTA